MAHVHTTCALPYHHTTMLPYYTMLPFHLADLAGRRGVERLLHEALDDGVEVREADAPLRVRRA